MSQTTSSPAPVPFSPSLSWINEITSDLTDYNLPTPYEPLDIGLFERHNQLFEKREVSYKEYIKALFPDVADLTSPIVFNATELYTRQFKIYHPYDREEIYSYLRDQVSFMGTASEIQGVYFDFMEIYPHQSVSEIRKYISQGPYPDIELVYCVLKY